MDSQREYSKETRGSVKFDSEDQTNFSPSPRPKADDSVLNLYGGISRPVVKHQLGCLIEENENVDYPPPRLITGLPEPINVDDPINKDIVSPKAPCLLFTTDEIKNYIDHLETKLNILYENMQETNRYMFEVLEEKELDKSRIKNQQSLLDQQEVELIFYRKFYKTGKNKSNKAISDECKQLKSPPKTESSKHCFGRKLNIEMHPIDVDPDIKDVVDQRVQNVLQVHTDEEILSPNPDFQNIHPPMECREFYPCSEPVLYDVPVEFQDTNSTSPHCNPLGSSGSSTSSSSPSPNQDITNVSQDSQTFEEPEIYEVPLQFRDKEISKTEGTSRFHGHSFDNVASQEELGFKEAENINQPRYSSRSPSPQREVNEDVNVSRILEGGIEIAEADYKKAGCGPVTTCTSFQDTTCLTNLMASIKDLSTEITKENAQQNVADQMDNESLTEKERKIIEEIEKYVGINDTTSDSSTIGIVPYVPTSDTDNYQHALKFDLVTDADNSRHPVSKTKARAVTAPSESSRSKKKVKAMPIEMATRRYPLQPVYRSNTQKTILPPIRSNNKIHKPQSNFTSQDKLGPDISTSKSYTPVVYKVAKPNVQSDDSNFGIKSKSKHQVDELLMLKQSVVQTKPITKENNNKTITDNQYSLPQIKSASTKPHLKNQIRTTIFPDKLKPGHISSQYASTSSATRHLTKSANYKPPKVLLPVEPKIYNTNRRKEKQPHKLPPICHLGLDNVFPFRKD